ncbi:unnamed protein product [Polarella glacialis]|uniref:Uncharacterized protein n=1 Tax=Polarella glacialis TaxID=89957 RepID=A0A813GR44_POLGL|nr:unnamed protein product [Polarella glacialis]
MQVVDAVTLGVREEMFRQRLSRGCAEEQRGSWLDEVEELPCGADQKRTLSRARMHQELTMQAPFGEPPSVEQPDPDQWQCVVPGAITAYVCKLQLMGKKKNRPL